MSKRGGIEEGKEGERERGGKRLRWVGARGRESERVGERMRK